MDEGGLSDRAVAAIRAGDPVLLPTDTVYGLIAGAQREQHAARAYALKGRLETQPTALLTASVDTLMRAIPELDEAIVRSLLPGPYTLVLANPARRFRWLTGTRTDAIGVRVPRLPAVSQRVLDEVECVLATSANDPGGPNPATLDDVPRRIRAGCAVEIDIGPLPGAPSTVIDFTGEPYVIREGIAPAAEAIAKVRRALA